MDLNTIIGVILVVASLGLIVGLVLWSRRAINRISRGGPRSARSIIREFQQGDDVGD